MENFKIRLCREEKLFNLHELLQGDILNLVDKMIEVIGKSPFRKLLLFND